MTWCLVLCLSGSSPNYNLKERGIATWTGIYLHELPEISASSCFFLPCRLFSTAVARILRSITKQELVQNFNLSAHLVISNSQWLFFRRWISLFHLCQKELADNFKLFAAALALNFSAHAMISSNGSVATHQVHFDAPQTLGGDVALPHPNHDTYRYNQTMDFRNVSSDKYVPHRVNHTNVSHPKSLPIGLVETERLNGLRSEKAILRRDIQASASAAVAHGVHPYVFYRGDGTTDQGWPSRSEWLPFETL
jgi:hypothetical protein